MPITNHQLTIGQLADLHALAGRCQRHDGNNIPIYDHVLLQYRNLPCNVLYYKDKQLIGFLSVFFFYDDACELILMIDPEHRRCHFASYLISIILPVINARELTHILCPSPQGLNNNWFPALGFHYLHTEVHMERKPQPLAMKMMMGADMQGQQPLAITQVNSQDDIPALAAIDAACFQTETREMEARFHRLLNDKAYHLLLLTLNGEAVGKAHLHQENGYITLSDIAVLPSHQGRGLGNALISHCIHHALEKCHGPLRLYVETSNLNALHLYQKLGFESISAWDFWKISFAHFLRHSEQ